MVVTWERLEICVLSAYKSYISIVFFKSKNGSGGGIALLVKCLPYKQEDLSSRSQSSIVVCAYNPSSGEAVMDGFLGLACYLT